MNKAELIAAISADSDISKAMAGRILSSFTNNISSALKKGESVALVGFGTFSVKNRLARVGRNPQTGDLININAANVPIFKAGKLLKEAVN
jgi:DNA-binding protein HU-beta